MFNKEITTRLQNDLKRKGIGAYLINTADPHGSEYIAAHYLAIRKAFAPFTGSAGTVVLTEDKVFLFTDGRYWIQAENELEGSGVILIKQGDVNSLTLFDLLKEEKVKKLGVDFSLISENEARNLKEAGYELVDFSLENFLKDLPILPKERCFKLGDDLNTLTSLEKIDLIYKKLDEVGVKANLITTLDDIAYILNIRGNDIPYNPVFYSYLYLSKEEGNYLFIDKSKIEGIDLDFLTVLPYEEIFKFLKKRKDVPTLLDYNVANAKVSSILTNVINKPNPSHLMKAIKGETEIRNIKEIQAIDGVALLKFQKYLEDNLANNLTEFDYSEKLKEIRLSNTRCFDLSFGTIAAVGANAAQMHYAPTKEKTSFVNDKEIELLVDSGGQYFGGTTDTTRTFLIGKPTEEYIHDYTLTLKAVIAVSSTIFLEGSNGQTIDIRAREFMWKEGMDYKCGTGHGVGYILNVHEGPNGFRYKRVKDRADYGEIVPGMVTTIEPGVYKANKYGIRIENNLLCEKAFSTSDGNFFKFETITYVPIETRSLDLSLLTEEEKEWIDNYHKLVRETLMPLVKDDSQLVDYLKKKTRKLGTRKTL